MPIPADAVSKRKPYNHLAGYVASRKNPLTGDHVTTYIAAEQGIDTGGDRYAVVCEAHGYLTSANNMPQARDWMKDLFWCEECQALEGKS